MSRPGWDLYRSILGPNGQQIAPDFLRFLQGIRDAAVTGTVGAQGEAGATGATGPGVAAGGASGDVLAKTSATDYATGWITLATVATSGSAADLTGTLPDARLSNTITAGSSGDASHTTALTFDAHGRLTAATSTAIAIASGAVSGLAAVATSGSASDLGSGTLPAGRFPALTGDVTTVAGALASTLATVNVTTGAFGDASHVATFTVNGKGLTTAAGSTAIAIPWSAITSGVPTTLSGYGITDAVSSTATRAANLVFAGPTTGAAAAPTFRSLVAADMPAFTGDATSSAGTSALTLATSGVTAASYGDSSHVAQVTFDAKGRATTAASVAITPAAIGAQATSTKDTSGGYPGLTFGTWTPTVSFATVGSSSFTYSSQFGQYVVIGNLVYIDFFVTFTPTIGTGSGVLRINGIPFPLGADLDSVGVVRSMGSTFTWPTGCTQVVLASTAAGASLQLACAGSAVAGASMLASNMTTGSAHTIGGTMIYRK